MLKFLNSPKKLINILCCPQHKSCRSSRPEVFCKKGVFKNFIKFTGTHLCQSLFFNKVAGLRPATLLKKRLCQRCFPMNFMKFLRTPFLQNTYVCVSEGKKCSFFEKFGVLCLLETPVWRFALLPYYRQYRVLGLNQTHCINTESLRNQVISTRSI